MTKQILELKQSLATAYRVLLSLGLFDYAGDVSVRVPNTDAFLIRGTRVDVKPVPARSLVDTTTRDILMISLDGNQLEGDLTPPLELPMHLAIYAARPAVASVVHAHARMVTAFSMVGHPILPVYARGVESTGEDIPLFDSPDPVGTLQLGEALARALGDKRACMLRSHGLLTVGATLESACLAAINLEEAAQMQWTACAIGEPQLMPAGSIEKRQRVWENPAMLSQVWRYYTEVTATGSLRRPVAGKPNGKNSRKTHNPRKE